MYNVKNNSSSIFLPYTCRIIKKDERNFSEHTDWRVFDNRICWGTSIWSICKSWSNWHPCWIWKSFWLVSGVWFSWFPRIVHQCLKSHFTARSRRTSTKTPDRSRHEAYNDAPGQNALTGAFSVLAPFVCYP